MPKQAILGGTFELTGRSDLLSRISEGKRLRVATLNPEFMLETLKNLSFLRALEGMSDCTIDGFGLFGMLKLFRMPSPTRYPGANLVHDLLGEYSNGGKSFYLLGGLGDEAQQAAKELQQRYPNIRIVGAESGGKIDASTPLDSKLLARIEATNPDILLVGFGAPKQELWINAAKDAPIQVMIGVGGSFEFYATKRRAPKSFQVLGIEWLYRGVVERGHWRRVWRAVIIFPLTFILWQLRHE